MGNIFTLLVYQPIYNLLVIIYDIFPLRDFGISIVLVTVLMRLILAPISKKQIEAQKKMQELQPRIKELQEKYKNDKERQTKELLVFYKENKANPLSGCLPTVVQLIFLIAIYRVLFNISSAGLMVDGSGLYPFVPNPGQINHFFLGIVDLSKSLSLGSLSFSSIPHLLLIVGAAAAQYIQTKMLMAKTPKSQKNKGQEDFAQIMSQQMLYLGPLLTLFIGFKFPAGLALYWLVSTLFSIYQQRKIGLPNPQKNPSPAGQA